MSDSKLANAVPGRCRFADAFWSLGEFLPSRSKMSAHSPEPVRRSQ